MLRKGFFICLFAVMLAVWGFPTEASPLLAKKDVYTIVIDPGHGGDNLGTISNENFNEKEITMKTAKALVEELSKYDGVKVLMTRQEDVDLSLKDRAVYAADMDADFLFSLHYNASENHTMFGTEVWIPLEAPYHTLGYQFAYLQQLEMQELGLFSRGIKTRRNDKGTDYYGILRESVALNVPAVIIEHCYVDEARDSTFCDDDEDYIEFGKRDARAIAKFLGLEPLEEEHSELFEMTFDETVGDAYLDETKPDVCIIEAESLDKANNLLTISVRGKDTETPLMYYDYSLDGGITYSKLYPWPGSDMLTGAYDETFSLIVEVTEAMKPHIVLRAYNKFDIFAESNVLMDLSDVKVSEGTTAATEEEQTGVSQENRTELKEYQPVIYDTEKEGEAQNDTLRFVVLCLFVLVWVTLLIIMGYIIYRFFLKKKRF